VGDPRAVLLAAVLAVIAAPALRLAEARAGACGHHADLGGLKRRCGPAPNGLAGPRCYVGENRIASPGSVEAAVSITPNPTIWLRRDPERARNLG
jgi:hypothetical protein